MVTTQPFVPGGLSGLMREAYDMTPEQYQQKQAYGALSNIGNMLMAYGAGGGQGLTQMMQQLAQQQEAEQDRLMKMRYMKRQEENEAYDRKLREQEFNLRKDELERKRQQEEARQKMFAEIASNGGSGGSIGAYAVLDPEGAAKEIMKRSMDPVDKRYDVSAPDNVAAEYGIPESAPNVSYGLRQDNAERAMLDARKSGRAEIDALSESVSKGRKVVSELGRYESLLDKEMKSADIIRGTGPVAGRLQPFDPEILEMSSISSKLTPAMRDGLPGAASDRDTAMFRDATVGTKKPEIVNRNIIQATRLQHQRAEDEVQFKSDYLKVYGTLDGANAAWGKYLNDNPILTGSEDYSLNQDIVNYKDYFKMGRNFVGPKQPGNTQASQSGRKVLGTYNPETGEFE